MKKSEELRKASQSEENDLKSFGLLCKALRESRSKRFEEDWLPLIKKRYHVDQQQYKYTIITDKYGLLDFYPRANKLLIRKDNKWIKPGLSWIIKNLMNGK